MAAAATSRSLDQKYLNRSIQQQPSECFSCQNRQLKSSSSSFFPPCHLVFRPASLSPLVSRGEPEILIALSRRENASGGVNG